MSSESASSVPMTIGTSERPVRFARVAGLIRMPKTRRRRLIAAAIAVALMGGSVGTAEYLGFDVAKAAVQAANAAGQSFKELMKKRSPGERTGDQLTKTKSRRQAVLSTAAPAPSHKAAPGAAPPRHIFAPAEVLAPTTPVTQLAQLTPMYAPPPPAGMEGPPGTNGPPPPDSGNPWPPSGCCTGGGGPPVGPPPPPPPPGVPEPSTWAMMLIGFGFVGWSLRNRQVRAQRAAACA